MKEINTMTKGKKYGYQLTQDGETWTVEITRRVSARKTIVSKRQTGFASEGDAQQWGQDELKEFLKTQSNKNKSR